MNELQQVLLVFAVIVVVGLYLFSRQRSQSAKKNQSGAEAKPRSRAQAPVASQPPLKEEHEPQALAQQSEESGMDAAPLDHSKQPFWDNFEDRIATNPVFEIDDIRPVDPQYAQQQQAAQTQQMPSPEAQPNYQATQPEQAPISHAQPAAQTMTQERASVEEPVAEPQVFAILVLTASKEFSLPEVAATLIASGLTYSNKGTYIKSESGHTIIQAANVMEPGTFPAEPQATDTTPGVALILQLPAAIPAPRAMDELVMTARRVSQRLNGRMYDMHRHLIRESDIQAMREAALDYQSVRLS